jgi:hypothetical protein
MLELKSVTNFYECNFSKSEVGRTDHILITVTEHVSTDFMEENSY